MNVNEFTGVVPEWWKEWPYEAQEEINGVLYHRASDIPAIIKKAKDDAEQEFQKSLSICDVCGSDVMSDIFCLGKCLDDEMAKHWSDFTKEADKNNPHEK